MSDYAYDEGYRAGMQKMREVGQRRIEELEAKLAKAVGALVVINALAPESMVNGYSQSDLTEIVSRMGKVTRTTLIELKGQDDEV
ncbi:hypothetical protein N9042_01100 [bacterium]|jgi:hypothetical protein|nr:hypothetical protein [bacterium]